MNSPVRHPAQVSCVSQYPLILVDSSFKTIYCSNVKVWDLLCKHCRKVVTGPDREISRACKSCCVFLTWMQLADCRMSQVVTVLSILYTETHRSPMLDRDCWSFLHIAGATLSKLAFLSCSLYVPRLKADAGSESNPSAYLNLRACCFRLEGSEDAARRLTSGSWGRRRRLHFTGWRGRSSERSCWHSVWRKHREWQWR